MSDAMAGSMAAFSFIGGSIADITSPILVGLELGRSAADIFE